MTYRKPIVTRANVIWPSCSEGKWASDPAMLNAARVFLALRSLSLLGAVREQEVSDWTLLPDEVADSTPSEETNKVASSMLAAGALNTQCDPAQEKASLQEVLRKLGYASEVPDKYCGWTRVSCGSGPSSECVIAISLRDQGVDGQVPKELVKLRGLQYLYFSNNPKLVGDLHDFQHLTQLQRLHLDHTAITGKLEDLKASTKLQVLDLTGTKITGKLEDVQNMQELRDLRLIHTEIAGTLQALQVLKTLQYLDLTGTKVSGDINELVPLQASFQHLTVAQMTGRLTMMWFGRLQKLQILDLKGSKVVLVPDGSPMIEMQRASEGSRASGFRIRGVLPALKQLSVSGCPLNTAASSFLRMLKIFEHISLVDAAGCNLTGDLFLSKWTVRVQVREVVEVLDLSKNRIKQVAGVPAAFLSLAENELPLSFQPGVLTNAVERGSRLDLTDVNLANKTEAQELVRQGKVSLTPKRVADDADRGFSCYGLKDAPLDITPSLFLPELCGCLPAWQGTQINCTKCGPGSYNPEFNQTECKVCPQNSSHKDHGAVTMQSCRCDVGRIFDDGHGKASCMCEAHAALFRGSCADCGELHLECPDPGSRAETARPQRGYARLEPNALSAARCLEKEHCGGHVNSTELGCTSGRTGPLCITCAEGFRSSGGQCTECGKAAKIERWPMAAAAALLLVVAGSVVAWRRSRAEETAPSLTAPPSLFDALGPLLLAQGPVLLQLLQLWGVLAALQDSSGGRTEKVEWDQEFVQWLQFTASGVRDALSLECIDGRMAGRVGAFASPCLPLLLLALCGLVEALLRGQGVSLALKVLSVFFIGGASSCAKLLECQRVDGGGSSLGDFAFRSALPHLRCSDSHEEALWANYIGWGCFASYSLLIPIFLVYLIVRQRKVMTPVDHFVCFATADREKRNFQVSVRPSLEEDDRTRAATEDKDDAKEAMFAEYLMAAALAHSAIYLHGRIRLQRTADAMKMEQIEPQPGAADESQLDVTSMMSVLDQSDVHKSRCRALTRMLAERQILEQEESDRILMGAKEIFFKYATCENVWLEVAMKLISGAVVVVVAIKSLMMTLLFTMGTAILFGYQKPYRQHQVNDLQSCCFLCLSVSAVGFAIDQMWLARCAVALPFALAGAQLLFPDGPEALALRLFEAATLSSASESGKEAGRARWPELRPGGSLELCVKPVGISFW
ncbi:FEA2 [Symbiodinium sp. CCMP2592]|nr:FEA2 [Symbiodinium sp. CCMP2592]